MKTMYILPLLPLLLLTGCSGKQTNASLEVSRAFALSNSTFSGGLIITGKKINSTQSFSVSLSGSSSIRLQLDPGTWFFSAVGWDGGATPKPFGGDPLCGWTQKDLSNPEETIDLFITKEKCADSATNGINVFAAGHVDPTVSPQTLKKLSSVVACDSFFTSVPVASDNPAGMDAAGGYSLTYCDGLPEDLRGNVNSFRILSVNKLPGEILPRSGFNSGCFNMNTSDTISTLGATGQPFSSIEIGPRLPYSNIPFIIQTFEENDCTDLVANYYFNKGLAQGNSNEFDHVLSSHTSDQMKLLLPGSDTKRGRSPFIALLPYFKKNNGSVVPYETLPSTQSYEVFATKGDTQVFLIEDSNLCSTFTASSGLNGPTCVDKDDKREITISVPSNSTDDTTQNFSLGSNTYNVYLADTIASAQRFRTQKIILETIGRSTNNGNDQFFYASRDEESDTYGVLKEAREMMLGAGAVAGISGTPASFTQACQDATASKEITVYDNEIMKLKKYKLELHDNVTSSPTPYLCDINDKSSAACPNDFEKRLMVFDYEKSPLIPSVVIEFSCSNLIGRMETLNSEIKGLSKYSRDMIVSWNADPDSALAKQRLEFLIHGKKEVYNAVTKKFDIIRDEDRRMGRLFKTSSTDFEVLHYDFKTHFDTVTAQWSQSLDSHQITSTEASTIDKVCFNHVGDANFYTLKDDIFSEAFAGSTAVVGGVATTYYKYELSNGAFAAATMDCTGLDLFTSQVIVDTSTDGINNDDHGSDQIDQNLPLRLDTLNSVDFLDKFGTGFLTAPAP